MALFSFGETGWEADGRVWDGRRGSRMDASGSGRSISRSFDPVQEELDVLMGALAEDLSGPMSENEDLVVSDGGLGDRPVERPLD